MKKQFYMIMLAFILTFSMIFPAVAEEGMVQGVIPEERLQPLLVDEADLLSEEEEENLLTKLEEISTRQECEVAVVTVNSLNGSEVRDYADDFYDYNGYGFGDSRDGILLLISMENSDWWISTCGYGITAFTDAGIDYISDKFVPMLSKGDYSGAFEKYAVLCDEFITQAREGEPYDTWNMPKEPLSPLWLIVDIGAGLLIAGIIASKKKGSLKTVRASAEAQNYVVSGSMNLIANSDHLLNKTVTSRPIKTKSSSSGGSSTHTSSSGTTHGGSGGKF